MPLTAAAAAGRHCCSSAVAAPRLLRQRGRRLAPPPFGAGLRPSSRPTGSIIHVSCQIRRSRFWSAAAAARPPPPGAAAAAAGVVPSPTVSPPMNPAVREALQAGRLGYGFSAGGFLYPYHLGVLWELKEMGVLRDKALLAGASAGSLAVAVYNCGIDVPDATAHLLDFAKEMRRDGTRFRLDATLRGFLRSYLPADAHQRCSGSTAIAVTRVLPYLQPELVTDFHSKEDLVEALLASCHIPLYSSGRLVTTFRGSYAVDGGVLNFIPSPKGALYTAKVSCFPVHDVTGLVRRRVLDPYPRLSTLSALVDLAISPDAFEPFPHSFQTMLTWALVPAPDEVLHGLIAKGRRDARTWAQRNELLPLLTAGAAEQSQLHSRAQQKPTPQQHQDLALERSARISSTSSSSSSSSSSGGGGSGSSDGG